MDLKKASQALSKVDISIDESTFKLKVLWFRVMKKESDWAIERHSHASFEFHYVMSGDSVVTTDDGDFRVKENQMYITAPGVYHAQTSGSASNYIEYSLNCSIIVKRSDQSEELQIMNALSAVKCQPIDGIERIKSCFDSALSEAVHRPLGYHMMIKSLVKQIILETVRKVASTQDLQIDIPVKSSTDTMAEIDRYISTHRHECVRLSSLQKYLHLSTRHINRIVWRERDMSVKDYLTKSKVDQAKELLSITSDPVTQISDRLGFSSVYYFSQYFKKHTKLSPSDYRKMSENDKKRLK